jgi:hypothetical protein
LIQLLDLRGGRTEQTIRFGLRIRGPLLGAPPLFLDLLLLSQPIRDGPDHRRDENNRQKDDQPVHGWFSGVVVFRGAGADGSLAIVGAGPGFMVFRMNSYIKRW